MPNGHKTCRERRCGEFTISLSPNAAQPYASRFLPALPGLVRSYRAAGLNLEPAGPVFVKTAGAGYRLTSQPATYAVLRGVLSRRAAEAGLTAEHFTGHSTRRGRMQGDADAGVPAAATQERALGICTTTYQLYTDRDRPLRREASGLTPPGHPSAEATPVPMLARVATAFTRLVWRT